MPEYIDVHLRPQAGPQYAFLNTPVDIAIYGGAAGGGKSYALLLECLRNVEIPGFGATIFRRNTTEILSEGGLWDESYNVFGNIGRPRESRFDWTFPAGPRVSFRHMEHEKTRYQYQGAQIPFIGFDEVTEFTWKMFSFMLSRNRSTCGVWPYIRATCNPDPDSFVAELIDWYIDDDGYPILERSGVPRWFVNLNDQLHWADQPGPLVEQFGKEAIPKSFTFIPSSIYDNKILLDADPGYMANLMALPYVERMRLLKGNWHIRPAAGTLFRREWFEVVEPGDDRRFAGRPVLSNRDIVPRRYAAVQGYARRRPIVDQKHGDAGRVRNGGRFGAGSRTGGGCRNRILRETVARV
jgi:hypothetical protein